MSIVIQEISQLRHLYKEQADTILHGSCAHQLYFPALSLKTCTDLELLIGKESRQLENGTYIQTPLLSRDSIRTLKKNQALFLSGHHRPMLLRTYPWYRQWKLKKRVFYG